MSDASKVDGNGIEDVRAALVERRLHGGSRRPRPVLARVPRTGVLPLSFAQERLWFLQRLRPDSVEYALPLGLRIRGPVDGAAVARALTAVVERHEVLRSRLVTAGEHPVQVVDVPEPVVIVHRPVGGEAGIRAVAEEVLTRPFDLAADRPLRAYLLRLAAEDYVLLLVFHHAVFDGWSSDILVRELTTAYPVATAGRVELPELPLQYSDYAAWQREWMSGPRLAREVAHWRDTLSGLTHLDLPTDHPRSARWDPRGDAVSVVVPAGLARAVVEVGARARVTPFMVFLAAFGVLLGRYADTTDVAVGTPVSGRGRPETQELIGFFVNTLVLRMDLSGGPTFTELLGRVRDTVLDAFDHQDVPFGRLVEALAPERDLSRNPLFGVMFGVDNTGTADTGFRIGELAGEIVRIENDTAKFDLNWTMEQRADGSYVLDVQYALALFERETVERMTAHFLRLLESVAADPSSPVDHLDMMTGAERDRLFAGPARPAPPTRSLPELFDTVARRTPAATALVHNGRELSYADLDRRSNRLANHLRGLGFGAESIAAVLLPRGLDVAVAILGVLKAGGAYVPVDPGLPEHRRAHILADTGATVAVADETTRALLPDIRANVVTLTETERAPDGRPGVAIHPAHLAYVIYTSGSTGVPKGVTVTHANVARLFTAVAERFAFSAADVWSCTHSFSFDVSVWELWGALLHGARCVIADTATTRDPGRLLALLQAHGVTRLSQTPSAFAGLTDLVVGGVDLGGLQALRTVIFAGEALTPSLLAPWFARLGPDAPTFVNMYGITETTVHVTYREITAAEVTAPGARSPIGPPMADLSFHVLDPRGEPQPVGVPGEIHVGGPGVTRGYLGRPGLTAERFVPDPFSAVPGARLYRSGDQARLIGFHDCEYLGRLDQQVKIRGFRIELGEVEAALVAHPGVRAAVAGMRGAGVERGLVAYVVPGDGMPDVAELRSFVAARLSGYMVPSWWVEIPEVPLTSSGKVDRRRLPAPDGVRPRVGAEFVAPRDDKEELVARVWAEVLGVDRVGIHDNFFELGGDSIKAVRLAGRLDAAGVAVTVADVFSHQTVAVLSAHVRQPRDVTPTKRVAPFELLAPADRAALSDGLADAYPVSAVQAGMLYEMLADRDRNLYHNVTSLLVREPTRFSPGTFRAAADLLVTWHEALRTSYDLDGFTEPLQLVWSGARAEVECHDLRSLADAEQRGAVERFVACRRRRPLDIARAPLMRFDVHQVSDTDFWLTATECHAILDGWSHHSLIGDLLAEYRALAEGGPAVRLPRHSGTRYADFVAIEREAIGSADQRAFWARKLESFDALAIPQDWARTGTGTVHDHVVDIADLLPQLHDLARAAGAPVKSVLLAGHLVVLGEVTGLRRFRTGLVCNGRLEVDGGDEVRGMFLNTVPLGVDLRAASWIDLVRAVFREEVDLQPYRRFPLPTMKQLWPGSGPAPDVVFNYLDFQEVDDATLDRSHAVDQSPNEAVLNVTTEPGALLLSASSRWISAERARWLAGLYRTVLTEMTRHPRDHTSVSFLTPEELRPLAEWNATTVPTPRRAALQRVAEVAAREPDRVALVHRDQELTYGELDRRINRLAHHLRSLGVGPDTVTGVLLPRSPELVVALAAVLRAGGAYLPLDPTHPAGRIESVLGDAGVMAVVTGSDVRDVRSPAGARVVVLDDLVLDEFPDTAPQAPTRPANLAYVIYTSGSTGAPKGVAVTRGAVENVLTDMVNRAGLTAASTLVAVTTIAFDIALIEVFAPLAVGARLVLADEDDVADSAVLAALVDRSGATVMQATPVSWQLLLDGGWSPPAGFTALCGGEKMPARLATTLVGSGARVRDLYGPTETTVWSAGGVVNAAGTRWSPMANTMIHVLDRDLRPVRTGVPGEVYIGGAGLARGYFGRPGLTADRFVPDPFGTTPGGRLYRTGDVAVRRDGEGVECGVEFLGRADHQVKVRGFRIELGEVEAVLADCPGVRTAVVGLHCDGGDRGLVGYVVPDPHGMPTVDAMRAFLALRLPEYMVPSWWAELAELPTTASGKVDRRALPAPDGRRRRLGRESVAPRTPLETTLARVWAEILGVDDLGVHDDFFDLGGHSLLALRVVGVLRREHGIETTLRDLVATPSVAGLAATVSTTDRTAPAAAIWFRDNGNEPPLFCVHPGGGSGHWYEPLAKAVGDDHPVAAFEWPGLNGTEIPLESVAAMAELYLDELRARYAHGPYRVLGWCGGAPVAWEIVHRLRAAGEEVEFSLLDPVCDLWFEENVGAELALFRRCEELFGRPSSGLPEPERRAVRSEIVDIMRGVVDDDRGTPVTEESFDESWHQRVRVWRRMLEVQMAYRFTPMPGSLRLIVGDEVAREEHEVIQGKPLEAYVGRWRALATGGLDVVRTPGDHFSVLRPPQVANLAELVAPARRRVDAGLGR